MYKYKKPMVDSLPETYPHQYKYLLFVLLFILWFGVSSFFYTGLMIMVIYTPTRTLPYITRFIQYLIRDIQSYHGLFKEMGCRHHIEKFFHWFSSLTQSH